MTRAIHQRSDRGRVRPLNEDAIVVDEALGLAVVCDGVGGHGGGDEAATLVAGMLHSALRDQAWAVTGAAQKSLDPEDVARVVRFAVKRAHAEVVRRAQAGPNQGMATTLTAALAVGSRMLIAHVGDSRAYMIRDGEVTRLTEDHVVATTGLDGRAGVKRRMLSRAVGSGETTPFPDLLWVDVRETDVLVLCSDGLSDTLVDDEELWEAISTFGEAAAPEVLVDLANTRGGADNISVVVMEGLNGPSVQPVTPFADVQAELLVLRDLRPFARLALLELEDLRGQARVNVYHAGDLIDPGTREPYVGFVARGNLELAFPTGAVITVGSGEVVGETSLTERCAWPYSARAQNELALVTIPVAGFDKFLIRRARASTSVLWELLHVAGRRLALVAMARPGIPPRMETPAEQPS